MAERIKPVKKVVKEPKPRAIRQTEAHAIEISLDRRDGSGVLVTALVDVANGSATFRQVTTPITFKGKHAAADVHDLVEFYSAVEGYLSADTPSALQYDEDEAEAEAATA